MLLRVSKLAKIKRGFLTAGTWFEIKSDASNKEDASKCAFLNADSVIILPNAQQQKSFLRSSPILYNIV